MPLGVYISVPFCRTKCSYCNFASGVFSPALFTRYVDRVCVDIGLAVHTADRVGAGFDRAVDSVYLGGGTPTVLDSSELQRIFHALRENFEVQRDAEITVECAPGTLTGELLEALLCCGVNRVSLGVQSFVDVEASAVGRLHTREVALADIGRLRSAGMTNINLDLIAGLPHQTSASWRQSLEETTSTRVPHVSLYMLEVDQDSRLGRELIAGGTRYHAHFVPDEDATADFYLEGCQLLDTAGVRQYEISNFAREGRESRHNLKYWNRQPYLGFGVDAHSLLRANDSGQDARMMTGGALALQMEAVRFATPDSLNDYLAGAPLTVTPVSPRAALEESFFLGLRLTRGVDLRQLDPAGDFAGTITELRQAGLAHVQDGRLRLTARGRLLSNEVFQRFLSECVTAAEARSAVSGGAGKADF